MKELRYIVVTGGVMSGLGKGITAASIGRLLMNNGYKVTAIKIDPYINIDAGLMSPFQHGEVYVLKDGGEVDLDLGNYERFLDVELTRDHNITTGKIYSTVIDKERRGEYLGKTVQIIPHITEEIKRRIRQVSREGGCEICLIEVGGTVGDIESMPFLEAMRQLKYEESGNIFFVHVTLAPSTMDGEQKTKPTQHSVKEMRELGLQPDMIAVRCEKPLLPETKSKIAHFCDVPIEAVISCHDAQDIYKVPLQLDQEGLTRYLMKAMRLFPLEERRDWADLVRKMDAQREPVRMAIVGKYTSSSQCTDAMEDAYLSIREAIKHAGIEAGLLPQITWIDAEELEAGAPEIVLRDFDGILVPGGFGSRGTEGKIKAITYARERKVPYLGICFGMQLAVIEFARNVCGLENASSTEFGPTPHPVIALLPEQENIRQMGATMRLGNYPAHLKKGSLAEHIYGTTEIVERHRHRYEVNPAYIQLMEKAGLIFSGTNGDLMEIAEILDHPFFFSSQFHPEMRSRPNRPSPPFLAFVQAMKARKDRMAQAPISA
ncbi:MAG TPA: CTP synthase (glutamine hydrolyzing) [Methanotrichaceae archaeon]|nr:CTP synthase (glutamine hydrolyzing) [Methanotrichaceae archaeon]HQF17348.1 CTP synthase (glutamine hydrolyzing) [Methanotrichaceae archaeon]HQI91965.1 CTP synthase (glutamine hydrolyzing) [Methanotrichaceae archaeon]